MTPMNSDRSENRSITESQNPPNRDASFVASATLPSMKSKMLATSMTKPAVTNSPSAKNQAAMKLMNTPVRVSTLGWIRSATHARMMARSGNMQAAPTAPVNVMAGCGAIMGAVGAAALGRREPRSLFHAHS